MSSGDEKAFRKLYDLYYDKIFAVSLSFTKSQVISEEIVQDVFLKIWLKREVFSGVHDFEAYLFITARNHILNCLRSRMKEVVFLDYLHSYFVVSEDVTSILHTKEIHKFIAEARELLPPQQRRVFELSRYEGLNYQAIAEKLGITKTISFKAEEISKTTAEVADIAIALHACDTATDDAIAWAVNGGSKLLLIAPCCHHDIQKQIDAAPEPWGALTKFGLMKERLGDLLTDSFRSQLLRLVGYRVEVIEFIGGEHTPRNLMIRAVKTDAKPEQLDIDRYLEITAQWGVKPALEQKLSTLNIR